jgi:hypothetical protein
MAGRDAGEGNVHGSGYAGGLFKERFRPLVNAAQTNNFGTAPAKSLPRTIAGLRSPGSAIREIAQIRG